jgi:hypothetical protein
MKEQLLLYESVGEKLKQELNALNALGKEAQDHMELVGRR